MIDLSTDEGIRAAMVEVTSRPATDKTLRGAIKPYLDALLAADAAPAVGESLELDMKRLVGGQVRKLECLSGSRLDMWLDGVHRVRRP